MFHTIRQPILDRMKYLEQMDAIDRKDDTPHFQRLRQIPPETGKFLALLAAIAPEGIFIEIGTSAGYSALWISLACELLDRRLFTYEISPEKIQLAHETFHVAQVENYINLVHGDVRDYLTSLDHIAFCFLDAEKELYGECYQTVVPKLVKGGLLIADNVISHKDTLKPMIEFALADVLVDALIVPIGKGVLVCRKA